MSSNNEKVVSVVVKAEEIARPLGRVTARELSAEEIASVGGGWTFGISNAGGAGDKDLMH